MINVNGGHVWECDCGHVEYGEIPPQECEKCMALNSFTQVPEDQAAEIEDNFIKENIPRGNDEDDE